MKFFLHVKTGRVYQRLHTAVMEKDGASVVVYQKVKPFHKRDLWADGLPYVRPAAEFDDHARFRPISPFDAQEIVHGRRTEPMDYAPQSDDLRCPNCWTSKKVTLGDSFLSGCEAECSCCGQSFYWSPSLED